MEGRTGNWTTGAANVDFVRSLGAETVVDYTATPFEQVVHHVDLVLDTIGGETLQRSMNVVKRGGTLVSLLEPTFRSLHLHFSQNLLESGFAK